MKRISNKNKGHLCKDSDIIRFVLALENPLTGGNQQFFPFYADDLEKAQRIAVGVVKAMRRGSSVVGFLYQPTGEGIV